jgi:hypothetical protein
LKFKTSQPDATGDADDPELPQENGSADRTTLPT